jgi:hypothetical protein
MSSSVSSVVVVGVVGESNNNNNNNGGGENNPSYNVKEFVVDERDGSDAVVLNHSTVDDTNGVVFIGAVN